MGSARLGRVFGDCGTFAVTILGHGQDIAFTTRNDQGNDAIAFTQVDTANAGSGTAH
ncbi:hypothetical protein D3C79_536620 [compost metagenome]